MCHEAFVCWEKEEWPVYLPIYWVPGALCHMDSHVKEGPSEQLHTRFQKVRKDSHVALLIELEGNKKSISEYGVLSRLCWNKEVYVCVCV